MKLPSRGGQDGKTPALGTPGEATSMTSVDLAPSQVADPRPHSSPGERAHTDTGRVLGETEVAAALDHSSRLGQDRTQNGSPLSTLFNIVPAI